MYRHPYYIIPDVQHKCRTNDVHLFCYKIVLWHPENITFEQGFYIYLGESTKRICTSLSHKLFLFFQKKRHKTYSLLCSFGVVVVVVVVVVPFNVHYPFWNANVSIQMNKFQ